MLTKLINFLTLACFWIGATGVSQAQFQIPYRYNEGPGIKLGSSLVLHPGIDLETRMDSNVFQEENNTNAAPYLRIVPHLHLATLSPQRLTDSDGKVVLPSVAFRWKLAGGYREYLSSNSVVQSQRAFEAMSGITLNLFQKRLLSIELADDYARTVMARNAETTDVYARNVNSIALMTRLTPGGGRLSFGLGYGFMFDIFEDSNLSAYNKFVHQFNFSTKLMLFSKTAISLDAYQQLVDYYDRDTTSAVAVNNPNPLRVYLTLSGLITPRISTILKVGYGNSFHDDGRSFSGVLGKAEFAYFVGPTGKFKLGYEHLFNESMLANYFTDELIYLGYDHLIAGKFLLYLRGDYRYRQYEELPATFPNDENSHILSFAATFDYQIKEWISVGIGYNLNLSESTSGGTTGLIFAPSYVQHQVFAKVGVSY